jgi:hypothetical protein
VTRAQAVTDQDSGRLTSICEGKSVPFSNHNPEFRVNLAAILLGAKPAAVAVLELLAKPR